MASEATNFLVGHNTLDLDIRRAAEIIGWDARRAFAHLPRLAAGTFVASGPAFSAASAVVTIGAVRSRHMGHAPALSAPPLPGAEEAEVMLGLDELQDAADAANEEPTALPAGFRAVRGFIAEPAAPLATRMFRELLPLYPSGAALDQLAGHLSAGEAEMREAVALLQAWNAVAVQDGAIRIERAMADRTRC